MPVASVRSMRSHGTLDVTRGRRRQLRRPITRPVRGTAAASPPYLEHAGNTVRDRFEHLSESYKVKACGCRSRFCARCCQALGYALRDRLRAALSTFRAVYMLTLTVDPELFRRGTDPDPEGAYRYLCRKRCVARLVDQLYEAGYLRSKRYFYVVEWQEHTEFPHFHVVLDAQFIPFREICRCWNSFRPPWAGPIVGKRPGFGSVQFTKRSTDADGCARYVSKYLTKHPQHGYPAWVMDAEYRIRRFSTSRGFWGASGAADAESCRCADGDRCECTAGNRTGSTIRARVASCGGQSIVLQVTERLDLRTGEVVADERFVCRMPYPIGHLRPHLGCVSEGRLDVLVVKDDHSVARLRRLVAHPSSLLAPNLKSL